MAVNAFHVIGGSFALWALLVSFIGVKRQDFPASQGAMRAVIAISILLFLGSVSSAVLTALHEHNKEEHKSAQEHALILPV